MAWDTHYRYTFINWVRDDLGDCGKLLFTEDQLKSYIDRWMCNQLTTATAIAFNERYRVCGCGTHEMIHDLNVTVGVDDAVYILDEVSASVLYAADDPGNLAASPVDGSSITVTFYRVDVPNLMSELFFKMSSSHAKLAIMYDMSEMRMDLKKLTDAFYAQAVRWKAEASC